MSSNNPDWDHNLVVALDPVIKAKITEYRKACESYALRDLKTRDDRIMTLKIARYNLEQTIATHLKIA